MTQALSITWANGTVDLNDGTNTNLQWFTPHAEADDAAETSDTIQVKISGTSYANLQSNIQAVGKALTSANGYAKSPVGAPVYINYTPEGYTSSYRSELMQASLINVENPYETNWGQHKFVMANLEINRRNFWESGTAIPLTMANSNGTNTSIPVFGCDDLGTALGGYVRENYLWFSDSIQGDLPAPLTFTIGNTGPIGTTNSPLAKIWIGAKNSGISATSPVYDSGDVTDVTCSSSNKTVGTLTTSAETTLISWSVNPTQYMNYYHVMARFANNTSLGNAQFRLKLVSGSTTIWTGEQFTLSTPADIIQDLGVIRLPPTPAIEGQYFPSATTIVITIQRITSNTETISLDYAVLMQADNFSYLEGLVPLSDSGGADYILFGGDDKRPIAARYISAAFSFYPDWIVRGNPSIMIYPNVPWNNNILRFMFHSSYAGTAEIERKVSIGASYRPRRRTL